MGLNLSERERPDQGREHTTFHCQPDSPPQRPPLHPPQQQADNSVPRPQRPTKSVGLAIILSFFWCGLGQLYCERIGKGLILMILYAISILLVSVVIGLFTTPILWIYGMYDANNTARQFNEGR